MSERQHVAYIMSRFPKLTETFILYEMIALEDLGFEISIYPLLRQNEPVVHPEAARLVHRARFLPFVSLAIARSQLHHLRRRPRAYLTALATIVRANAGSRNYLIGALAIFPKVAHLARLAVADEVDHVHAHFSSHPAAAGFILHRLTGVPFSFTAHGSDLHVDRHMLREKVAAAEFVVSVSEYNGRMIVNHCGPAAADKTIVIHTGVDTAVFAPRAVERQQGGMNIACVGSFVEVKGQAYLIEACRLLAESGIELTCHLVGDGPCREELVEQVVLAGLNYRVRFVGPLDRRGVAGLLSSMDALIAPSVPTAEGRREGIPVAIMEAMAMSLPVVASRISGIPELVHDGVNGLLVPPRDAQALAAAIGALYRDPELRSTLGAAGRQKVVDEFDIRKSAQQLAERIEMSWSVRQPKGNGSAP